MIIAVSFLSLRQWNRDESGGSVSSLDRLEAGGGCYDNGGDLDRACARGAVATTVEQG
jgi:hypothetical protein